MNVQEVSKLNTSKLQLLIFPPKHDYLLVFLILVNDVYSASHVQNFAVKFEHSLIHTKLPIRSTKILLTLTSKYTSRLLLTTSTTTAFTLSSSVMLTTSSFLTLLLAFSLALLQYILHSYILFNKKYIS